MDLRYSVLMSVYYKENPEWLDLSINSMIEQTVFPDEFVIIKDGKLTIELDNIIEKYKVKYPKLFKIIELKENVGLGVALSIGINHCKNELIARMDSDDYSVPNRCEIQLKYFEKDRELDIVGSFESEFMDNINNVISIHKVPEKNEEIEEFMRRRCALLHPTVMYKKSSVLKSGNYMDVRLYEDYDLFIRMVKNGAKCYNVQDSLYYIRINENFFKRRGGLKYLKTVVSFKKKQYEEGFFSLKDFIISAGSQAVVCLLPNKIREYIYIRFLR